MYVSSVPEIARAKLELWSKELCVEFSETDSMNDSGCAIPTADDHQTKRFQDGVAVHAVPAVAFEAGTELVLKRTGAAVATDHDERGIGRQIAGKVPLSDRKGSVNVGGPMSVLVLVVQSFASFTFRTSADYLQHHG